MERGIEPPEWYYTQPEIWMQNQFYWDAFWDLGSERPIGMGVGPIPRAALRDYAQEYDITGDAYDVFLHILRKLDHKYLELNSSSNKASQDKGLVADADDLEKTRAVMDVIKARAAAANKRQVKRKVH